MTTRCMHCVISCIKRAERKDLVKAGMARHKIVRRCVVLKNTSKNDEIKILLLLRCKRFKRHVALHPVITSIPG